MGHMILVAMASIFAGNYELPSYKSACLYKPVQYAVLAMTPHFRNKDEITYKYWLPWQVAIHDKR